MNFLEQVKLMSETHFPGANYKVDLLKAKHEIDECIETPTMEEHADIIIAVLNSYQKTHGTNMFTLAEAIQEKITKNMNRKWKKNEDGTYSHIKELQS